MKLRIIKLGGSVITSRDTPDRFNRSVCQALAEALTQAHGASIVVHGTGHVGKPPAITHGYLDTGSLPREQALIALRVREQLQRLHGHVVKIFLDAAMPAFSCDALHFFDDAMEGLRYPEAHATLSGLLDNGLTPVFQGDFLPHADGSFRVLSSDVIVAILARLLQPEEVLFFTDVDGVYAVDPTRNSAGPMLLPRYHPGLADTLWHSAGDGADVSGGMAGKLDWALRAARHCAKCIIANGLKPDTATQLLRGASGIGTLIANDAGQETAVLGNTPHDH